MMSMEAAQIGTIAVQSEKYKNLSEWTSVKKTNIHELSVHM